MTTRPTINATLIALSGSAAIWLIASSGTSAHAQDALGSGNILDNNLSTTGRSNVARPNEDYAARNLIVTGNVAGGRGFRGSVGYTAPSDFRGRVGSDSTYNFRANSAYSDPELFRLGNTFQQLRFGQDLGVVEFSRDTQGSTARDLLPTTNDPEFRWATGMRLDRGSMISSPEVQQHRAAEPRTVGMTYGPENQPLLVNASVARGLLAEPPDRTLSLIGLSTFDAARLRQDIERGGNLRQVGSAFETDFASLHRPESLQQEQREREETLRPESQVSTQIGSQVEGQVDRSPESDYARILQRVADRYAGQQDVDLEVEPQLLDELSTRYSDLRERLQRSQQPQGAQQQREPADATGRPSTDRLGQPELPANPADRYDPAARPDPAGLDRPDSLPSTAPPAPGSSLRDREANDRLPGTLAPPPPASDFSDVLRHGTRVERLSTGEQDRFNELLAAGEQKLQEGDYFWAERRFERALRFTPGHPLAMVGIAHSQIGAGLHLSASFTLRNLFQRQPEMIDATYASSLLPSEERMNKAIEVARQGMADSREPASFAFLLAYLGRQTGNQDMVREGLDAIERLEPTSKLLPLLRGVWLGQASAKPDAAQQGQSGQPAQPVPPTAPAAGDEGK